MNQTFVCANQEEREGKNMETKRKTSSKKAKNLQEHKQLKWERIKESAGIINMKNKVKGFKNKKNDENKIKC